MLLADLHVHTRWSDGKLSMGEVVDLFGRAGHDVIAITDHVVNTDNLIGKVTHRFGLTVTRENFAEYRQEIEQEARRAWDQYRMLVVPGCELTQNTFTRHSSAHALALGIDEFISADGSVEDMLTRAKRAGALTVACHPHKQTDWYANTFYLWKRRSDMRDLVDLWELACRWDLFPPVARARLPYIGNSDFHIPQHLYAWKTLLPCEKRIDRVLETLRRGEGLAVTRLEQPLSGLRLVGDLAMPAVAGVGG
ncbi:MAG TPA: PHP domain-containing protein [Thermoanaerobaculia bacterium]|nr:PHP domain-containing protein [Thermoanaerobaculia bacterium]